MSEQGKKSRFSQGSSGRTAESFRSVLVPLDFTPGSDRVVGRLVHLPLAKDARLTLLHVVPGSLHPHDQRSAESDAKKALATEARHLAKELPKGVRIEPVVRVGTAAKEIAACASTAKAELIVMGRGSGRALRDTFLGSTAERVIRRGQLPVLVVRLRPREPYGRPALALDLDRAAHDVVSVMLRIVRPPRPRIAVIHAFDAPYQTLAYPSISDNERTHELELKASEALTKLLGASLAKAQVPPGDRPRWKLQVRYGSPRIVVAKAVKKAEADLLVLGTHGYAGVAHLFLGTVAGDLLREVACNVLVVPPSAPKK